MLYSGLIDRVKQPVAWFSAIVTREMVFEVGSKAIAYIFFKHIYFFGFGADCLE
jgi:hypothetical protein